MSETEKLLKENIVDYKAAKEAAEGYLGENHADLSKRFCYAGKLSLPVRENQAFFLCDEGKPGKELLKLLMDQFRRICGGDIRLLFYIPGGGKIAYDSEEYWEALACSGYLISNTFLPGIFVKRKEQTYFNPLFAAYGRKSFCDLEGLSRLPREFLKTDVTLGASAGDVREAWGEKAGVLGAYGGTILLCGKPAEHAGEIAQAIFECGRAKAAAAKAENSTERTSAGEGTENAGSRTSAALQRYIPENTPKKRILVLTSWKMPAEQTYLVKRILAEPALSENSVTVLSSLADEPELLADFAALPAEARVMYRGKMVLTEPEALTWKILEKNPDACVNCSGLADERNRLMRREWRRIWGSQRFDVCLVLGSLGWQQYHMAMAGEFDRRILVDLDFLDNFREKAPVRWNRAVAGFDGIFCPCAGKSPGAFGLENKERVRRLPVFSTLEDPAADGETVKYGGHEYVVCGSRKEGAGRRLILLQLPAPGAVLGRDGLRMDERFWNYLYFLPAAGSFFHRLSGYVKNPALEYDAAAEICESRGVPEER